MTTPGTLYIVSTPIGNLGDITLRALDILKSVDLIAAEDTRKSGILLNHYQVTTPMTRYHDHNKEKVTPSLIANLQTGQTLAVISDAGTPGISDPAFYLVREAVNQGLKVEAAPGATAMMSALVVSGLPTDRFAFEGFLPVKKGRQTRLNELQSDPRTLIIYESPNRIERTLRDLYSVMGERQVVLARELTKKFEQIVRGTLGDVVMRINEVPLKGEFVILVEGFTRNVMRKSKTQG